MKVLKGFLDINMLQDSDLQAFLDALETSHDPNIVPTPPSSILVAEEDLFSSEVWRLVCSLQIAAASGDIPQKAPAAAQVILEDIGNARCAPLSDQTKWTQAIAWACMQPALANPAALGAPLGRERETIVGAACRRLRDRGYKVVVGAYGPQIDATSRRQVVQSMEALVGILGGVETVSQILRFLREAKLYHDGLWLFGEAGLNLYDRKLPMIPVGWLLSLALRNLGHPGSARKPAVAWKSLVDLSSDFAAAQDCQRYSQYGDSNLHPSQIHRTLADSTLWREFFTLPQMPPRALRQVLRALETALTQDDEKQLGFAARHLFAEVQQLVDRSSDDRLTVHPREGVERALPLLHRLNGGAKVVNVEYRDPLAAPGRTQDHTLLFACGRNQVLTLPRAMLATAACEFIFRQVWAKLGKRANDIIKDTLEGAIATACQGKAMKILPNAEYHIGKARYEIDVAARSDSSIVLIETKGKMLTSQSRAGDMFSVFRDYSDSFLRMLGQLVRHEIHLRQGQTPLTVAGEVVDGLRPMKIAVSPLSYGPVSDKMLSSSLIRAFVDTKLKLIMPNESHQKIMDDLNARVARILADMLLVAPKHEGLADLYAYLIDVFWLDLGQLLYILNRAYTVSDAFYPIKHVTFSSRDFWTELAHADRMGLTKDKWAPVG